MMKVMMMEKKKLFLDAASLEKETGTSGRFIFNND